VRVIVWLVRWKVTHRALHDQPDAKYAMPVKGYIRTVSRMVTWPHFC